MANQISKELKGLFIAENIQEIPEVRQEKCFTLQAFNYDCTRRRMDSGEPYGDNEPASLTFTVRVNADYTLFHSRLNSNEHYKYSFIFNALFDEQKKLLDNNGSMVVDGFVVDVQEHFDTHNREMKDSEQMLVTVRILICSIDYIGSTNNKTLFIAR